MNEQKEKIKFFIDDEAFVIKKFFKNDSLSVVRQELIKKNNIDFIFTIKDGFKIEKEEENEFSLMDILDEDKIYLKSSKNSSSDTQLIDKPKENITKNINNNKAEDTNNTNNSLLTEYQIRNNSPAATPISNNYSEKKKNENTNIETSKDKTKNFEKKEDIKIIQNPPVKKEKKIKIFINGNYQFDCELNKNLNLIEVKQKLKKYIKGDFLFLLPDGFIINHEEEEIFSVEGILNEDKIYINQEKLIMEINDKNSKINIKNQQIDNKNINKINEKSSDNQIIKDNQHNKLRQLINQCKKLDNIGNLEIYLYPRYKFSSIEMNNSLNFMVVGQTGSGKTTLLNAFLNYLLGIKFEDDFRFKLIHEDFGISMAESQTRDVIIYNIRPLDNNLPLIRVIDTPGFGDTGGLEKDKLINDKIAEKFRADISHINAICFVAQSTNAKLTINQKYIFNSIMDLFSEDIKENFIAMLTFCNIIDENPVILEPLKKKGQDLI